MALSDPEPAHACERVEGESKGQTPAPAACFVYILHCSDGRYCVGSASDVAERERNHNEGPEGQSCPQAYTLPLGDKMNEMMLPLFGLGALLVDFGVMVAAVVAGLYVYDRFVKKR